MRTTEGSDGVHRVATSGLVLAAGAGRRLGRPKADLIVGGVRLIDRAVGLLRAGGCSEVVAVVRSAAIRADDATTIVNPDPDLGMGSSLRIGLQAVSGDVCIIVLVDQIGIEPSDISAVAEAHAVDLADVVVARRGGKRSHPVLVSRDSFGEFGAAAEGDQGARRFIDLHPDRVRFVDLPNQISDIDTPADLAAVDQS
ncbi:nucleotidyltransferase family protein [Jatrophihabitans sp. DSM 45814]